MRGIATLFTTLALTLLGLVFSSPHAYSVPSNGQYVCTTGDLKTNEITNLYTITDGAVSNGGSCTGAVVIRPGVTSIGISAFFGANDVISIAIPSSVTSIGTLAFVNAAGLTSITVDAGNSNFSSPTTGPDAGVLFNKLSTEIIVYPKGKVDAYYSIPSSVTSIGSYAFGTVTSLTSITIPSSVTSIGEGAFNAATGLTSITIPSSVISIGDGAFRGATGLTSISADGANEIYSSTSGVLFNDAYTTIVAYPIAKSGTYYSIPATVTSIGDFAFDTANITSVTIPPSVTSIGRSAFENSYLTSVTIPASVTSIGYYAFWGVKSLTSVTIPASVTSIGNEAFKGAILLASVYFLGDAPATVGTTPIMNTAAGAKVYIKSGATGFTTAESPSIWKGLIIEVIVDTPVPNDDTPSEPTTANETETPLSPEPTTTPLLPGLEPEAIESPINLEPVTPTPLEPGTPTEPTVDIENAEVVAFSPLDNPAGVAGTAVTTLALAAAVAAAGAAGSAAGAAGSASRTEGSAAGAAGSRSGGGRASGSIATINVELTGYETGNVGSGDRFRIWALPIVNFLDRPSHNASVKSSKYSPLLSKLLIDGAHLRAMLGSAALIGSFLAIGLGTKSAIDSEVMPPPALVLGIIAVIGAFDALAGFLGMFSFAITAFALADERSSGDIRLLMGIVLLGFGPILLANSARNFRGQTQFTGDHIWERITDIAVGAFLAGWSAIAMVSVLPALAGLTLPIAESATEIGLAVAIATVIRIAAEQVAARLFPTRLKQLHPAKVHDSSLAQKIIALTFRAGIFFFVAAAFIGYEWYLVVGTLLFIFPPFLGLFADKFPNNPTIYQLIPAGIPGLILNLALGAATVGFISSALGDDPLLAKLSFVLVPIPFFIIAILSLFGREPRENDVRWYKRDRYKLLYRVGGTVAFFVVLKMTGILA